MKREVIIACDFKDKKTTFDFLEKLKPVKPFLKIGMELFYREGAPLVLELKQQGYKIFLDLKLHDIPNTVYSAMKNIASLGVDITNVHASGGIEMMKMAKKGLNEGAPCCKPLLIAVTQLTSTNEEVLKNELLIETPLAQTVQKYAENAKVAGLDGVVCSPLEAPLINKLGLICVTPGIRLAGDSADDQKRIATPKIAKEQGSDFIVVGRSITNAVNPLSAYKKCCEDFCL